MDKKQHIGILLAGGLSRRYGSPKAFAMYQGKAFYRWTYEILAQYCKEVVIVTRPELQALFPNDIHTITDLPRFAGCGPLAGIYSGIEEVEGTHYIVLPCDMPLMEGNVIKRLMQLHEGEVSVVQTDKQLQPLVSIWNRSMKEEIFQSLQNGVYQMRAILDGPHVNMIPSEQLTDKKAVFMNINTKEEERGMEQWIE